MTPTAKWPRQLTLSNYEIEASLPGFQTTGGEKKDPLGLCSLDLVLIVSSG
jgi:hypothetical protein